MNGRKTKEKPKYDLWLFIVIAVIVMKLSKILEYVRKERSP